MNFVVWVALSLAATFLCGQVAPTDANAPAVKVFPLGAGVTSPELLPDLTRKKYVSDHCTGNEQANVTLSTIIDSEGNPRNIYFLNPHGDDLDVFALKEAIQDHFKPGTKDGKPVAVALSLDVSLRTCLRDEKDAEGKSQIVLHLAAEPQQQLMPAVDPPLEAVLVSGSGLSNNPSDPEAGIFKVGGNVKSPVQFRPSDSTFALVRRVLGRGDFKVSVLVDRYGMPASIRLLDSEPGREKQIAAIVRLERFKPALLNGQPVPARFELGIHVQ